ncbi:MAG TPA: glycosyltransferase family 4 protein, partial [Candidatus Baltobacteraceae bacterium]
NEIKKAQIVRRVPTVATRLQVVPIGANIEPAEGVTWHPRSGGRQTLLAFGIVMPRRRIELLIATLKELVAGGIDADLCVAGRIQNSAYAAQCLQMANELGIADRVTFTGTLAPETVTELFLRSSLSLHAAEEGLISSSGALLAAFAHGVPVVGARTQTDEAMLLQATLPALSDARDIARVVTSALDDTASRVRAGTLGRQLYRGQFEWAHIAELTARSFNLNQKVTYAAGL